MTTTYTFDIFMSLDGFGGHNGDWGGYWGKQGPEFLDRRLDQYSQEQRMVFGGTMFRDLSGMLGSIPEGSELLDPWITRMKNLPTTVISNSLTGPQNWPNVTIASGNAADVIARLKADSRVPLRSHGSLRLNRSLLAAGLVDRVQVTLIPVITGKTGVFPVFSDVGDFDLELIESRTLDGNIQELTYRPIVHA
jgi:dihydrofolate reductase